MILRIFLVVANTIIGWFWVCRNSQQHSNITTTSPRYAHRPPSTKLSTDRVHKLSKNPRARSLFFFFGSNSGFFYFFGCTTTTMWSSTNSAGRFDLLLLEEGEYYLDDYSAVRCSLPLLHTQSPQPGALGMCKQVRGRIKVCSRSLMFDPEDSSIPVSSYAFKTMKAMMPTNFGRAGDQSSPELGSELFVITTTSVTNMREDGVHHPYRNETSPTTTADGSFVLLFALLHTSLDKVMPNAPWPLL